VQLSRTLVATIVVLAFAATGYVGSRIWPLPTSSDPVIHLAGTDNTSSTELEAREGAPSLTPQASKSAPATDPSASADLFSQSVLTVAPSLPETAQIKVQGSSTSSPDSSVAVSYQARTGEADPDGRSARKIRTAVSKKEHTAAARRKAASEKVSRIMRAPRTSSAAESSVVEFAPNPRPNQTLRDFMAGKPMN
jgi:hypothetical protein